MVSFITEKMEAPVVVLIHGKAGTGKNYIARRIQKAIETGVWVKAETLLPDAALLKLKEFKQRKVITLAFADFLKEHLFSLEKISLDDLTAEQKTADYRETLTSTADLAKQRYGQEYFARALRARIALLASYNKNHVFIVPDLREKLQKRVMEEAGFRVLFLSIQAQDRAMISAQVENNFDFDRLRANISHNSEVDLDDWTANEEEAAKHGFILVDNSMDSKHSTFVSIDRADRDHSGVGPAVKAGE